MNENTMWNDLYGLALTNMNLSHTYMQPYTQNGKPTKLFPVAPGWGLSYDFVDLFIFTHRNVNLRRGWCETLETSLRCDPSVCIESRGFQPVKRSSRAAKGVVPNDTWLGSHLWRIPHKRSRVGSSCVSSETDTQIWRYVLIQDALGT